MQKYSDTVLDRNGNVVVGATVTVTTYPGAVSATVYGSNAVGANVNPLTTDGNGYFEFWAPNGRYTLTITKSGITTRAVSNITIQDTDTTVVEYGALGDNSADDTTAVQAAAAALGATVFTPATGYKLTGGFVVRASCTAYGYGRAAPININGGVDGVAVGGSNSVLRSLYVNGASSPQLVYASASASNVILRELDLASSSAGDGIQLNQASSNKWSITNSFINTYSYSVLLNTSAGGSKGFIVANNFLNTQYGDCVEINSPSTSLEDAVVIGNVASVDVGSGAASGFSVGLAHVNGVSVVGNISQRSYLEAHHIEDGSKNITIVGNINKACQAYGLLHIIDGANSAQAKAIQVIGNVYEAPSITAGKAGIYVGFTGTGTPYGNSIIGNLVRNFESGLWLGGVSSYFADGNIIDSCTYAIKCETAARIAGTNHVLGTAATALLFVNGASGFAVRAGRFICQNKPTAIITTSGGTRPGHSIEGFEWTQPSDAIGIGTTWISLFAAPTRMNGRLVLSGFNAVSNADNYWYAADLIYDGTTLTVNNAISQIGGNISGFGGPPAIRVNAGQVQVGVTSAAAFNLFSYVRFDGVYMV